MKMITAASLALLLAAPAVAETGTEIGTLTCTLTDISNNVVYTEQDFDCRFEPNDGEPETYVGRITKIGLDLSVKNEMTIVWGVLTSTVTPTTPRPLTGTYVGAGADVAVGAGVGARVLVGGSQDAFTFQPISVTGVEGGGAALGIERFRLE